MNKKTDTAGALRKRPGWRWVGEGKTLHVCGLRVSDVSERVLLGMLRRHSVAVPCDFGEPRRCPSLRFGGRSRPGALLLRLRAVLVRAMRFSNHLGHFSSSLRLCVVRFGVVLVRGYLSWWAFRGLPVVVVAAFKLRSLFSYHTLLCLLIFPSF